MASEAISSPERAHNVVSHRGKRRLIVNADDFGRSQSINRAVIQAHGDGILTTASLMVNEPATEEAVALAREHPSLGVGLHLTFLCGRAALGPEEIPGLVNGKGEFTNNPAAAGFRYFFSRKLVPQLRAEMRAQFARFRDTGLKLDHVNGHLHLHLHPTLLRLLDETAQDFGVDRVRLTFDPLRVNLRLAKGHYAYRLLHVCIFHLLSARAKAVFRRNGWRHTDRVFGLLQNARVDKAYVGKLLTNLPEGDSELYSHPSLDEFRNEFDALTCPEIKRLVEGSGVSLIRYQDL